MECEVSMLTDDDLDNLRDLAKRQSANHAEKKILAALSEIERLRSLLAAMERGYKSYRDTAEAEFARLNAEIDRRGVEEGKLRGLLHDWDWLVLRGNATSTADIEEWTLRVRAELGRG